MIAETAQKQQQSPLESIFIITNQQKIKVIDAVLKDLNFVHNNIISLPVSVSYQPLKKQQKIMNTNDTLFQYNILGSKFRNKSRNSNLVSKIQYVEKIKQNTQNNEEQVKQNNGNQSQENSGEEIQEALISLKHQDNFRYFKDNIICFKCSKVGHYRAVCPQATACIYCLCQNHETENCPQKKVCYRCFGFGHIVAHCPSKQQYFKCNQCQKNHGIGCNFLVSKIKDSGRKNRYYEEIYKNKQIRCARCLQYGHIDCNNY